MALYGGVAVRSALLIAKSHVDPRRRVALLAPDPAVVVEPGVDRLLVWREDLALGPAPPRGFGRRSSILVHFLTVGSDAPTARTIEAIDSPPLALLRISSILSTPIIPLWPSSRCKPKQRHCWADCGWSACPCSKPKEFRAQARNFPTLKPATSRLSNALALGPSARKEQGRRRCLLPIGVILRILDWTGMCGGYGAASFSIAAWVAGAWRRMAGLLAGTCKSVELLDLTGMEVSRKLREPHSLQIACRYAAQVCGNS